MKTPGVYIVERSAFPNSVVEVPTGIPAFVGYTEKAMRGAQHLQNVPTRISSMAEYREMFGAGPNTIVESDTDTGALGFVSGSRFLMYCGLQLFFNNGGGPCWIVSVGGYGDGPISASALIDHPLTALEHEPESAIIVAPDAALLGIDEWAKVANAYLDHCGKLMSRVVILDVLGGSAKRNSDAKTDVISGTENGFRPKITSPSTSYGMAYYPWVDTNVLHASEIGLAAIGPNLRKKLSEIIAGEIEADAKPGSPTAARNKSIEALAAAVEAADPAKRVETHQAAITISSGYTEMMSQVLAMFNRMPPSAGMAGVFARTDQSVGVFKAPANTNIASVARPAVDISASEQEDLNMPLDGKAINAIRNFTGQGLLVWGARTLDGNSQDWRYINVRRTMIMLEQSIKYAAQAYVFEPNVASTWQTVKAMIENFLNNQWKAGALAGATPENAFDVAVGLGSTMTGQDVLDGYMKITVKVAITRPAEFIVLTFQQKMQTS